MSPQQNQAAPSSSFEDSTDKQQSSKREIKQQQQQQHKTTLPTSPSSLNQDLKPPMFTFESDELLLQEGEGNVNNNGDGGDLEEMTITKMILSHQQSLNDQSKIVVHPIEPTPLYHLQTA